jgi:hydroxymethylglutaryl-CoA lyase
MPSCVNVVEVGPRDGLQNEPVQLSTITRVSMIEKLVLSGLKVIEAGAFVSPKRVPQMSQTAEVLSHLPTDPTVRYPVLVPNLQGYSEALKAGASEIAIFAAASESFSQNNINCSIDQSIQTYREVCKEARQDGLKIRGYISCVLGCPYEGHIDPKLVAELSEQLLELGCYEISLGDTIGVGTPGKVQHLIDFCLRRAPAERYAVHFHDTYGQALANIYASLETGIATVDASIGGLGGCPHAPGATGNVATEEVVYMLDGLGIETGIYLNELIEVVIFISNALNRKPTSRASKALIGNKQIT